MKTPEAPERIYLQPNSRDYKNGWTWCWHDIDEDDIEYVRADLVSEEEAETSRCPPSGRRDRGGPGVLGSK